MALNFQVNDRLFVKADFQYIDAFLEQEDLAAIGAVAGNSNARVQILSDGDVPEIAFLAPEGSSQTDAEFFSDPTNYFYRAALEHLEDAEADEVAVRLDAEYDLELDFFKSVEVGVRVSEREQLTRYTTYNWGNVSETWAGGIADFTGSEGGRGFGVDGAEAFVFDGFHNGNVNALPGGLAIFPSDAILSDYDAFTTAFPNLLSNPTLANRDGVIDGTPFLPGEINDTTEENTSVYARVNFGSDDSKISGNVGLRYVNVDTTVAGGINFPTAFSDEILPFLPADVVAFANGFSDLADAENSYDDVLPSLNVKYAIDDAKLVRFGVSKAVSLPDLGSLRYDFNIGGLGIETQRAEGDGGEIQSVSIISPFRQTSGNPFLQPVESINIDLSYENYFADDGFFSVGVFHKDLSNFISVQAVDQLVTNPSNNISQLVTINQPINIADASLTGLEVSYQQFFDQLPGVWSGLGVQFNYTYLNPSDVPQVSLSSTESRDVSALVSDVTEGLPLAGLSENTFNLVGIFQNEKIEARLAYNWRDEYLLTARNVINFLPTFQEARGQLDGSFFYNITDSLQLGFQATNILEEETRLVNQVDNDGSRVFRSSFASERRLTAMIRGNF